MTSLRSRCALAVSALLGLAVVGSGSTAAAYCRTTTTPQPPSYDPARYGCITSGLPLFWRGACVSYAIQEDPVAGIDAATKTAILERAFATWNEATCADTGAQVGIQAVNRGAVSCSEVRYNPDGPNQNLIVFREDRWPYNDSANTLGLTTVTFNAETGEIYDADMEFNATGRNLSTTDVVPPSGFDLLSVVTHEVGHFLGLAHATDPRATMYAAYKPGSSALRTLNSDDVEGLCSIYPTSSVRTVARSVAANGTLPATACDPTPRHGFTTACSEPRQETGCAVAAEGGPRPWPAALAAGLVVAALAVVRRRDQPR